MSDIPLQKPAGGLTGWFQLKVGGRNPSKFGDVIVPTIDAADYYLTQGETRLATSAQLSGLVTRYGKAFTVPAGKMWRVHGGGLIMTLNAADVAITACGEATLVDPADSNAVPFAVDSGFKGGPSGVRAFGFQSRPPLVLMAGWTLSLFFEFSAALTVSVNVTSGLFKQEFDA